MAHEKKHRARQHKNRLANAPILPTYMSKYKKSIAPMLRVGGGGGERNGGPSCLSVLCHLPHPLQQNPLGAHAAKSPSKSPRAHSERVPKKNGDRDRENKNKNGTCFVTTHLAPGERAISVVRMGEKHPKKAHSLSFRPQNRPSSAVKICAFAYLLPRKHRTMSGLPA